jgi:hypothetical protein
MSTGPAPWARLCRTGQGVGMIPSSSQTPGIALRLHSRSSWALPWAWIILTALVWR